MEDASPEALLDSFRLPTTRLTAPWFHSIRAIDAKGRVPLPELSEVGRTVAGRLLGGRWELEPAGRRTGESVVVADQRTCSQAVSDYGAHNQRCLVAIEVSHPFDALGSSNDVIWIEELVEVAERHASAPIYPTLKREDERFVTMQAFDTPAFVEDVVRGVALELEADARVHAFSVEAVSEESIHNHVAVARIAQRAT